MNNKNIPENEQVHTSNLNLIDGLVFEELADNYTRALRIESSLFISFLFVVASAVLYFTGRFSWVLEQYWFYAIYLSLLVILYFLSSVIAKSKGFALMDKDIHYKAGIIWKKTVSLPFNRIQHVELESGPIERFFKLTSLKFFSAGGGERDMKIPALPFERSTKIRQHIMLKVGLENEEEKV